LQNRPLARGTHAKGVCARAEFEVFDVLSSIPDRALAARLAKGPYAAAGKYPAQVRFANADSNINSDSKRDVRAMSFSVELPGGQHQDYSTNDRTTFPINDAHTFAVTVKVVTASSVGAGVRALPFMDKLWFVRTAVLGAEQEHQSLEPYQKRRYWSTVPFRQGQNDVIKYSLTPCMGNPAADLQSSDPDTLQDEIVRHLETDTEMSCFHFGLQLLDPQSMTYWGRRRDASFWTENASVEWKESEAPFHTVGRLTLLPKSELPAAACDAWHIDVTENSSPETTPLGSINRARWHAEAASRKARLSQIAQ
jgi:catalase